MFIFDGRIKRQSVEIEEPRDGSGDFQCPPVRKNQIGFDGVPFGQNGDQPVAADYDDGKADVAVFRGGTWLSESNEQRIHRHRVRFKRRQLDFQRFCAIVLNGGKTKTFCLPAINKYMETEPEPITTKETERLAKLRAAKPETDENLTELADHFNDHPNDDDDLEETRSEQALEFLTGGERYIKD